MTDAPDRPAADRPGADRPGAAPRPFTCLWCGKAWQPHTADDLEARARLCPDCLGRAGENPFLRFRLRAGLEARAGARDDDDDDWYLRRGRYARGPVHDMAWQMELDAGTSWLDGLPLRGEIVELAAGTGWWSALLATKGELHAYNAAAAPLDRARDRLVAHRLLAHLHVRDAWAAPDRTVDALFAGFWLGHVPRQRLGEFLALARSWLKAGGRLALIDALPDPASGAIDEPPAPGPDPARRRLADGRERTNPPVRHAPEELAADLGAAGFVDVDVRTTGRFFVLATGVAR